MAPAFASPGQGIPACLWPLSPESLPTWTSISVVLLTAFARCFLFGRKTRDHRDERKRDAVLRNLDAILDYVAKKDEAHQEPQDGPDFGPEGMPEASRVMALLWDDVHDCATTEYGIPASDERIARAQALLKRLAGVELHKALHMTKKAFAFAKGREAVEEEEAKGLMGYWSGEKLRAAVDFQKDQLSARLGESYVDGERLQAAEAYLNQGHKVQNMGKLFGLIRPHIPTLVACFLLSLVQTVFMSVFHQIGFWMTAIEMASLGQWPEMQSRLLEIFFGHVIVDLLGMVCSSFQERAQAQLHASVTQGVLASLLQQDYEYFDRTSAGVLQERLNHDADQLGGNLISFPEEILTCLTRVLVSLLTVYGSVPFDLFLVGVMPLGPIIALQYGIIRFWRRMDKKMRKLDEDSAACTGETLREIKTVRQFAMESQECEKFSSNSARKLLLKEQVSTSHRVVGNLFGMSIYGGLVFTLYMGAHRVRAGEMTTSALLDMTFKLNFEVVHTLRHLLEQLPRFNRLLQPLARISELLQSSPKIEPAFGDASGLRPEKFHGLIEFDNVHFAYPKDARKKVLRGLTFTVEPGQKVALIGATGCGKSSTMSLLQRLYDPQQGTIRIDGRPLKDYDLRHLRRRIVIVDQFTVLFAGSVRDNITYGLPGATDDEIEQACREAVAWDFLQEKPDKLMTSVSSGGGNFSGGQKQRIAIARAIVRRPDVILLDEATASLDASNEKLVQEALDKLARKGSALVIAHRLSTIKDSDKIVVVDQGVKVEEGTHEQLLADCDAVLPHQSSAPAPALGLDRATSDTVPPSLLATPPPQKELSRAKTFHGTTAQSRERQGVTYRKLWEASTAKQGNATLRQMDEEVQKKESELAELKGKVHRMRAQASVLRGLPPSGEKSLGDVTCSTASGAASFGCSSAPRSPVASRASRAFSRHR